MLPAQALIPGLLLVLALGFLASYGLAPRYQLLLQVEESRHFTPFVVVELYSQDYRRLPVQKLGAALIQLFLYTLLGLSFALAYSRLLPASFFLVGALIFLAVQGAYALGLVLAYPRSAFARQTGYGLADLLERGAEPGRQQGILGEYYAWRLFSALPGPKRCFVALLIPSRGAGFAEVDLLLITPKGLFCVEAKNRQGSFVAHQDLAEGEDWVFVQGRRGDTRIQRVRNPFRQNEQHIGALTHYLPLRRSTVFNIVCFGRGSQLRRARYQPTARGRLDGQGSFFYYDEKARLQRLYTELPDILSAGKQAQLAQKLRRDCCFNRRKREELMRLRSDLMERRGQRGEEARRAVLERALQKGRGRRGRSLRGQRATRGTGGFR